MSTQQEAKRKLVLKMSVSLDGFVSGPDGEIDWVFRSSSAESGQWVINTTLREAGVHVLGSGSYYEMAAYWPFSDLPFAPPMNEIPKVVFSRTGIDPAKIERVTRALAEAQAADAPTAALQSWAAPTVARGDLAEEMARLKAQPGKFILAHGGAEFAQALAASGLVDEYRLAIHPVVLGRGRPLFAGLQTPADLRLVSATSFSSGTVAVVYQPA
jgi:dihydrofolate reductase